MVDIAISAPARSIEAHATSISRLRMTWRIGTLCTRTSYIDSSSASGSMPCDMVRLPWGSMSTHRTRWPFSAKAAARFSVVVVLATPPFWLANAMTFAFCSTEIARFPSSCCLPAVYSARHAVVLPSDAGAYGRGRLGNGRSRRAAVVATAPGAGPQPLPRRARRAHHARPCARRRGGARRRARRDGAELARRYGPPDPGARRRPASPRRRGPHADRRRRGARGAHLRERVADRPDPAAAGGDHPRRRRHVAPRRRSVR